MKLQARVNLFSNQTGNVKAFASVTLDGAYVINDLRVMDGAKGLWVSMPSKKGKNNEYKPIFNPITAKARTDIFDCVLKEYEKKANAENFAAEKAENKVKNENSIIDAENIPF